MTVKLQAPLNMIRISMYVNWPCFDQANILCTRLFNIYKVIYSENQFCFPENNCVFTLKEFAVNPTCINVMMVL